MTPEQKAQKARASVERAATHLDNAAGWLNTAATELGGPDADELHQVTYDLHKAIARARGVVDRLT